MKRDMDLIRQILIDAETRDFEDGEPPELYQALTTDEAYQIALMIDAGLVQADYVSSAGTPQSATIYRLTWAGHDFLDAARDNTIWKKAKDSILKPGISWTFSILTEWLKQEAHDKIFGVSKGS
jgi:hypothetical protein